jgi:hypothetical protein
VGALVWYALGPDQLMYLAFAFGCAGAAVFYLFARDSLPASPPRRVTG